MEKLHSPSHSHKLVNRLRKSEKSATEQLLHLFEVMEEATALVVTEDDHEELVQYLTALAIASKIHDPEFFAQQILFMATEARDKQLKQPESQVLRHAKTAAKALVTAQTKSHLKQNSHLYAMAASFFLIFGVTSVMLNQKLVPIQSGDLPLSHLLETTQPAFEINHNPTRLSQMLADRERMRQGTCKFPEALAFAETERGVYLKNVVHGEVSLDKKEQEITNRLMEYVSCDYTPMLMKNSIS